MAHQHFWMLDKTIDSDSIEALKKQCFALKGCYWITVVSDNHVLGFKKNNTNRKLNAG